MRKMPMGGAPLTVQQRQPESRPESPGNGGLIDQFVNTLDRFERHVLILHYVEGLSPMEIGAVLDVPGQRVYAALAELKHRTRDAVRERHEDITARDTARSGATEPSPAVPVH